jgi:hypothetical protein
MGVINHFLTSIKQAFELKDNHPILSRDGLIHGWHLIQLQKTSVEFSCKYGIFLEFECFHVKITV